MCLSCDFARPLNGNSAKPHTRTQLTSLTYDFGAYKSGCLWLLWIVFFEHEAISHLGMPHSQALQTFNQDCLEAHNRKRALHGCPALTLDNRLIQDAQKWAEQSMQIGELVHNGMNNCGENLIVCGSSGPIDMTGVEATQMWYEEIKEHDFTNEHMQPNSGHFTQLIWKDTKHCGFGKAFSSDNKSVYVVGRYDPPGNFEGEFLENVPVPLNDTTNA